MEAFPLGDGAELGIVRRNWMGPAGATLRLFAQWLRPTTIFKGSEIPWAVSFWRFPTEVPGCAADGVAPVTPETANFRARAVSILRLACG